MVALLGKMKESIKGAFVYQKKLATEYAKNIFVDEDHVGCFKTRRTTLAESSVWVVISGEELKVTNITPTTVSSLGISEYNLVLDAFFHGFISKYLDETWRGCVSLSGERISLSDILSEETFRALSSWESTCNKEAPISQESDRERWLDFVTQLHREGTKLNVADFGQWLSEDKRWPAGLNSQISDLEINLEYSLDLLNHYDGTDI